MCLQINQVNLVENEKECTEIHRSRNIAYKVLKRCSNTPVVRD